MTQQQLNLAPGLALPLDAVTRRFGILATSGAGKSNLAARLVEEFYAAGQQFVVIDPKGDWWGLRVATPEHPGLEIPIFGGKHGDLPLDRASGALIAELVVGKRVSCVLDVFQMEEEDKNRFLLDFAQRVYRTNEQPLHLVLDECDDYIPQKPDNDEKKLVRAWTNIVRRGRSHGLGVTLVTQRSAVVNKDVLTQIETLFALRTTAPHDRKAIQGWIDHHGQARELLDSLPGLADGEAWVWSPQWLKRMERLQFPRRRTFDSGATPTTSKKATPAARLADVDLAALRESMSTVLKQAEENDPTALKRRVRELEQQLAQRVLPPADVREVPVLANGALDDLRAATEHLEAAATNIRAELVRATEIAARSKLTVAITRCPPPAPAAAKPRAVAKAQHGTAPVTVLSPHSRRQNRSTPPAAASQQLERYQQSIVDAIARFEALGMDDPSRRHVAAIAGKSPRSSQFDAALAKLRAAGAIEYGAGSSLKLTDLGRELATPAQRPTTAAELLDAYKQHVLSSYEASLLDVLVAAGGAAVDREQLGERSGLSCRSSQFDGALASMRKLRLVEYHPGQRVSASSELLLNTR